VQQGVDTFQHAGFPVLVIMICYALIGRHEEVSGRTRTGAPADIIWVAAGVVVGACLLERAARRSRMSHAERGKLS
jgi:hypothetical protein